MDKRDQEKFWRNLNETSFYFFITVGLVHIISGMLVVNDLYIKPAWLVNRLLDLPFFIVTYIYLVSLLKILSIKKGNYSRLFDLYSVIIGSVLTVTLLIFDLIFSNQLPPT